MSATSASKDRIPIWDPIIRATHWLIAALFFANQFFTDPEENPHRYVGYAVLALLVLRLVWGITLARGPNRVTSFLPVKFRDLRTHLVEMRERRPPKHQGHNPLGAIAIMIIWMGLILQVFTGWSMDHAWADPFELDDIHELIGAALLWVVFVHIAAAGAMSLWQKRNLIRAMITGRY